MGHDNGFHLLNATLELFLLDLLLSGDNAILIALACRSLPTRQRLRAMVMGTGAAIVLRVLMTSVAGWLLNLTLLKLLGGLLLMVVAIKLQLDQQSDDGDAEEVATPDDGDLWSAVGTIIVADVVMSLDNVLGLAAASQGDMRLLALGLALSMPVLMFGSLFVNQLLQRYPLLVPAGSALLGWIAGDIAITDNWYADWVNQQSPGLLVIVPALSAAFVLLYSRLLVQQRGALAPLRDTLVRATALRAPKVQPPLPLAAMASPPSRPAMPPAVAPEPALERADQAVRSTGSAPLAAPPEVPTTAAAGTARPAPPAPGHALRRALRSRWAVAAASLVLVMILGNMIAQGWLPDPRPLQGFACGLEHQPVLYFNHGANTVRLAYQGSSVNGTLSQDRAIDWGDYHDTSTVLGLAPPTHIDYDDPNTVRVHGGSFDGVACKRMASAG